MTGVQTSETPIRPASGACTDARTLRWWWMLCAVSVANIVLWVLMAWLMRGPSNAYVLQQLVLSGIFVAACAFRSWIPRVDLERRCLWNTRLSSIFIGRSVATVAEMCFAAQCALFVLKLASMSGSETLRVVGLSIVPLIAVAQVACWYAVLSLNHLGHAIEEVLWAAMVLIVAVSMGVAWNHMHGTVQILIPLGFLACAGASFIMLAVDVPMYVSRWRHGRTRGDRYLPVVKGMRDALRRRQVVHGWNEWKQEFWWMTLYFSVGVWLSLAFVLT